MRRYWVGLALISIAGCVTANRNCCDGQQGVGCSSASKPQASLLGPQRGDDGDGRSPSRPDRIAPRDAIGEVPPDGSRIPRLAGRTGDPALRALLGELRAGSQRLSPAYIRSLEEALGLQAAANEPSAESDADEEGTGRQRAPAAEGNSLGNAFRDLGRPELAVDIPAFKLSAIWQRNWLRSLEYLNERRMKSDVFGGVPTEVDEYPTCVALGSATKWCCTGTLIGPNVVLTAAHCVQDGCVERVFVGTNVRNASPSNVYELAGPPIKHEGFDPATKRNDVALLILKRSIPGVAPAALASRAQVDRMKFVSVVGFGRTNSGHAGRQFEVSPAVSSTSCPSPIPASALGCFPQIEFVAGGNGFDSCKGDSGAPAFLRGGTVVAGIVSRGTKNRSRPCGDGGIYVRVDQFAGWIRRTAASNGGRLR